MAILASGLSCTIREVSLADKPAEMIVASPKATIPVMVLANGRVLEESLDIMRFVLNQNDPACWLNGVTDQTMKRVECNDQVFKNHLDHYKYPDRYEGDPLEHRAAGLMILSELNAALEAYGFLTGPNLSLIDVAILPFIRQFAAVNEPWFAAQDLPKLQSWLAEFLASPIFTRAMVTLPVWQAADAETLFPASDSGLISIAIIPTAL